MELEHLKNLLPHTFYPKKGVKMKRRLSVALLLSTIAATAAAASSNAVTPPHGHTPDGYKCTAKTNPYKTTFCVYFTGAPENVHNHSYTVVMHYLNLSGKPIRQQVNAYVGGGNGGSVNSEPPTKISSPVKYVESSDSFTSAARIIGLPGGLKAHQDIGLKLTFNNPDPGPNDEGLSFLVQFWPGKLIADDSTPIGWNTFYPRLVG